MFKIAWKSFRHNRKSFAVFFLSAVFSVSMIFGFMYLSELTREISIAGLDSDAGFIFGQTLTVVLVASVCIMLYSVKFYIRSRSRDYTMLLILGIRRKQFVLLLALEYIFSWIFSIIIGLAGGNLLVFGFQKLLKQIAGDSIIYSSVDVKRIYLKVFAWCIALIAAIVVVLIAYMAERNLSSVLQAEVKSKKPKVTKIWIVFALLGIALTIITLIFSVIVETPTMEILVFSVVGIYLVLQFGIGILYERYKRKHEKRYYKKALQLNSFYSRMTDNLNIIIVQIMIGVAFIYLIWSVSGGIVKTFPEKYPYDLVSLVPASKTEKAETICKKYGEDIKIYPCTRNWFKQAQKIGISESLCQEIWGLSFQKIWGNSFEKMKEQNFQLKNKEMVYIWGGTRGGERSDLPKNGDVPIALGWDRRVRNEMENYHLKTELRKHTLFGEYIPDVLVFSDEEFERLYKQDEASYSLVIMNGKTSAISKAEKELKDKIKGDWSVIQGRETMIKAQEIEGIVRFTVVMFGAVSLLFFLLFTLCIKMYSDLPYMKEKYHFLYVMGMKKKERRKLIKKEISVFLIPAALIASADGFLHCMGFIKNMVNYWGTSFYLFADYSYPSALWILPQMAAYLLIMFLFTFIMENLMVRWVEKENIK